MIFRVLGKRLRIDLRFGADVPMGHVGPCPPTRPRLEANSGGQFERAEQQRFGFSHPDTEDHR